MPFHVDFADGDVLEWETGAAGAGVTRVSDYAPTVFVGAREGNEPALDALEPALVRDPNVRRVERERWFTDLRATERSPVLRVTVERVEEVTTVAWAVRRHEFDHHAPGTLQLFDVDLSPGFRYCLETGTDPTPSTPLALLDLAVAERPLAGRDVTALAVDGEPLGDTTRGVLERLDEVLHRRDPDVLLLNTTQLVPLLYDAAAADEADWFDLGRLPGHRQLAGESVFERYGHVGHSPARYAVPGRAIVDRSTSFLWGKAGLPGLLELTKRSGKPVQEAGWASIGNLLTAIQIREALCERGVLVPWNKSAPEFRKDVRTLHAADRGGLTFDPRVGLFERVHELDFASLYPNIMIQHNVSPETVRCACHPERTVVPELGYTVCERRGIVPDVLEPIVADREALKAAIRATDDPAERERLRSRSTALKWILVTCFGYQGYKNAKFGRIEAHEAINAYARDVLLRAKAVLEANGWRVLHGVVDGLWVQAADDEARTPLDELVGAISADVGVRLEYERAYDWLCFVPRRETDAGALTKYFGKVREEDAGGAPNRDAGGAPNRDAGGAHGEDAYVVRGIELRQRSTPPFVARVQRELLDVLDEHRAPAPVCDRLQVHLARLRAGDVAPADLVFRRRAGKEIEEYDRETHTVAALHRYRAAGVEKHPGQDVRYVVVDDGARLPDRVRLPFEEIDGYDVGVYARELVRAAESVVSPLGWRRSAIRRHLRDHEDAALSAFE